MDAQDPGSDGRGSGEGCRIAVQEEFRRKPRAGCWAVPRRNADMTPLPRPRPGLLGQQKGASKGGFTVEHGMWS